MKNKLFLFASLLVMTIVSSCSRYEEGPGLSLRSKDARLEGEWIIEEYAGQATSGDLTMSIKDDGTYTFSSAFGDDSGTWEWATLKTEVVFTNVLGDNTVTIVRLANKELWYKDDAGELYKWKQD
jgi:hypothetical protein